jgi:hypothetical protein
MTCFETRHYSYAKRWVQLGSAVTQGIWNIDKELKKELEYTKGVICSSFKRGGTVAAKDAGNDEKACFQRHLPQLLHPVANGKA